MHPFREELEPVRTVKQVLEHFIHDLGPAAQESIETIRIQSGLMDGPAGGSQQTVISIDLVLDRDIDLAEQSGARNWKKAAG